MKLFVRAQVFLTDRWQQAVRGQDRERGASSLEWVLIAAACALLIAAVYAAINGKVMEKIGVINDA